MRLMSTSIGPPLTKSEQIVLKVLPDKKIFSLNDVYSASAASGKKIGKRYFSELLNRLALKQEITRVKKGVFYSGSPSDAYFDYEFGLGLCEGNGYVAFSTALYYHHLLDERPYTFFFATPKKNGKTLFKGREYVLVPLGENFYGYAQENKVKVSTVPKTFFDCFLRPRYAGGLQKTLECFKLASENFTNADWRELLYYLKKSRQNSFRQRTGFLLERLAQRGEARVPNFFLNGLLNSIARKTRKSVVSLGEPLLLKRLERGNEKRGRRERVLKKKWSVYP